MPLVTPQIASAQETRNAFVWIEFASPGTGDFDGYAVTGVMDVNNEGRIVGRVANGGAGRGFVITNGQWAMLKPDTSTTVRDMNNDGVVVGWTGADTGRTWSPEYSSDGGELDDDVQVEGINDSDEYVGYDTDQQLPVGWLSVFTGFVELPPLPTDTATAARGISNTSSNGYPLIVGNSESGPQQIQRPVAWTYDDQENEFTAHILDATNYADDDVPYIVNDNGWIVGSTNSSSPYDYLLWTPNGSNTWTRWELNESSGDAKAVGLNASNEIVADKTLFAMEEGTMLTSYSLLDMVDLPTVAYATPEWYPTGNLAFRAINDNGWIVGKGVRTDGTNSTPVVILLVPYDLNNNGEPDYREIIADPDGQDANSNWVLDWGELFRSGAYGAGHPGNSYVDEMENVQVVRLHFNQFQISSTLTNGTLLDTETFIEMINGYGYTPHATQENQREIVLMLRSAMPSEWEDEEHFPEGYDAYSPDYDYIPPVSARGNERTRDEILADYRTAGYWLAHNVDYIQIGNEIYGGAGQYYIHPDDVGASWENGKLISTIELEYADEACAAVFGWIEAQARAFQEGSAMAGRPVRIIGPALTAGLLRDASEADDSTDGRDAIMVAGAFAHTNVYADMADVHLHHEVVTDVTGAITTAVDFLSDETNWLVDEGLAPTLVCCTEWGPFASSAWLSGHSTQAKKYYEDWPAGDPPTNTDYLNYLQTAWLGDTTNGPGEDMGADAMFEKMTDANFVLACYGPGIQLGSGASPNPYDLAAVWCNHIHSTYLSEYPDRANTPIVDLYQDWVDAYELFIEDGFENLHPYALESIE